MIHIYKYKYVYIYIYYFRYTYMLHLFRVYEYTSNVHNIIQPSTLWIHHIYLVT